VIRPFYPISYTFNKRFVADCIKYFKIVILTEFQFFSNNYLFLKFFLTENSIINSKNLFKKCLITFILCLVLCKKTEFF
jgi:hypothetical protein